MRVIDTELEPTPSIVPIDPPDVFEMSDDECLARLAEVVREHDLAHLDEMAHLIARLAVIVE